MYAWGGNEYGQCGCNIAERDVAVPRLILPGVKARAAAHVPVFHADDDDGDGDDDDIDDDEDEDAAAADGDGGDDGDGDD